MRYTQAPNIFIKKSDSIFLISAENDDFYWEIDETGFYLWNQLQNRPRSIEELSDLVCDEFDIELESARKLISEWIEDLLKQKLILKSL